jgi:hypothetical protein
MKRNFKNETGVSSTIKQGYHKVGGRRKRIKILVLFSWTAELLQSTLRNPSLCVAARSEYRKAKVQHRILQGQACG